MNINDLRNTLISTELPLDELVFERLDMSYEDLLYELHPRILERLEYFEDLERETLAEKYTEDSDADIDEEELDYLDYYGTHVDTFEGDHYE